MSPAMTSRNFPLLVLFSALLLLSLSCTPPPSNLHHKGLIKTDWILRDHTCLWQVKFRAHVSCVYLCMCVTLCGYVLSTSVCYHIMCSAALSSPIRARWELCVCYTYALVCGLQSLTVHLHVICNTYAFHLCVCVSSFQSLLRTSRLMCWLDSAHWNQSLLCFNFTPVCASVMLRATRGGDVYIQLPHIIVFTIADITHIALSITS